HSTILRAPWIFGESVDRPTRGITGFVYSSIRTITALVGAGIDMAMVPMIVLSDEQRSSPERDSVIAAINGVLGDYLQESGNPLAIPMCLRADGKTLELSGPALAAAIPQASGKILLLAHGLCLTDQHWDQEGHDHGALLAAELGYTPVYLHYNTGLHISTNGRELADMLAALTDAWPVPVEEIAIVAHSMGGLVSRSACHYGALAGRAWLGHLRKIIFLGTPHHGSPLERAGNWLDTLLLSSPYSAAFARLGKIRSAGITDLRYGSLLDDDWVDKDRFAPVGDPRQPVPLPEGVACYMVAASTGSIEDELQNHRNGDGLVPVYSALGVHHDPSMALPPDATEQWIGYDMNHIDLLHRRDVYAQLREWLAESAAPELVKRVG
ncbi:MAG: alpha/beta hydrolase, partial [Oscillochloris sp.]|nr:alpha/beta hydrolase [Oscillochloris sp.]